MYEDEDVLWVFATPDEKWEIIASGEAPAKIKERIVELAYGLVGQRLERHIAMQTAKVIQETQRLSDLRGRCGR